MTDETVVTTLRTLFEGLDGALADNRLAGYVDDRMLELQENDPSLHSLLQHLMAGIPEDCNADHACHQLFILAYTIYKANAINTP